MKNDRQALSEKKFRKLLKKSVFDNFSERFGVSQQTQDELGRIYLDIEEAEAKAEADDFEAVKALYREKKESLEAEVNGCGKEGRKLLEHFKKDYHAQRDVFVEEISVSYLKFEEELKQYMTEYEIAVGTEGVSAEDALNDYEAKLRAAFEAHRTSAAESRSEAESKLAEIAEEYLTIGSAFHKAEEAEVEAVCEEEATDEAEETIETENEECVSANDADSDE